MHTNAGLQMAMSEVRLSGAVRYNASFTLDQLCWAFNCTLQDIFPDEFSKPNPAVPAPEANLVSELV